MDLDWFPFFLRDFDEGTREMTNEEVGAYLRLLYYQFHNGSIPADRERASRVTTERFSDSTWAMLQTKFTGHPSVPGDRLVNLKMQEVRTNAEVAFKRRSEANRLNGQKGGLSRGKKLRALAGKGSERIATESLPNRQPVANERVANAKHIEEEEKKDKSRDTTKGSSNGQSRDSSTLRARRSRRAPEDLKIEPKTGAWIQEKFPGVQTDTLRAWTKKQLEKLRNHEFNSPRSDWQAVIRNWVLECIDRGNVPNGVPRGTGDEEKAWQETLKTAAIYSMTKGPDEGREAFTARVNERNQRRLDELERQRRG